MRIRIALASLFIAHAASAEVVTVRDRGEVDLRRLVCESIPRSAIHRVCVDEINRYMIVQLGGSYLHYCEVDSHLVYGLIHAERPSRFFASEIKGRYRCQHQSWPPYD